MELITIKIYDDQNGVVTREISGLKKNECMSTPVQRTATVMLACSIWVPAREKLPMAGAMVLAVRGDVMRLVRVLDPAGGSMAGIAEDGTFECTPDYFDWYVLTPPLPTLTQRGKETLQ